MKTKRLREARATGLVLPQSGYEMSNDEMMYVDGGFWRRLVTGIGLAIVAVGFIVATVGVGAVIVGGASATIFGISAKKVVACGLLTIGGGTTIASVAGVVRPA